MIPGTSTCLNHNDYIAQEGVENYYSQSLYAPPSTVDVIRFVSKLL